MILLEYYLMGNLSILNGRDVYKCMVSWYGSFDAHTMDSETGEFDSPRARAYNDILVEIDPGLLLNDEHYREVVIKTLLNQNRITKYINNGLEENSNEPCGNYVGGIRKTEEGYKRFFNVDIGKFVHMSDFMVEQRKIYKEQKDTPINYRIFNKETDVKNNNIPTYNPSQQEFKSKEDDDMTI